ncbi:hypothetical protein D1007_09378 [Hordeum vulgare]|nr:hypothetical protein D1007_09378 [Hordeum vulgare]KAI5019262.1 hypothetical protein ZWY2020_044150 [Hordeum vulgare]
MDTKGAAEAMLKAAAPMAAEEEAMLKLKALAQREEAPVTGPMTERINGAASAAVERYWASLKSKTRAAGEYATLRTRQGVALFGEPNIGPIKTIVDRC